MSCVIESVRSSMGFWMGKQNIQVSSDGVRMPVGARVAVLGSGVPQRAPGFDVWQPNVQLSDSNEKCK